jgi:hypothetical protein
VSIGGNGVIAKDGAGNANGNDNSGSGNGNGNGNGNAAVNVGFYNRAGNLQKEDSKVGFNILNLYNNLFGF